MNLQKTKRKLSDGVKGYDELMMDFEKESLINNELPLGVHIEMDITTDEIEKAISIKTPFSFKTGILYKDGSFESRSCFKGTWVNTIYIHKNRPRDKDTMLLLQALGWTEANITE